MRKTISSDTTFLFKFVFPAGFVLVFGIVAISEAVSSGNVLSEGVLFFAGGIIAITVLMYFTTMKYKKVEMDENNLYVSNFINEIAVNKTNIENVKELSYIREKPIVIYLKETTEFGNEIMFSPTGGHNGLFYSNKGNPLVKELKDFANIES